MKTFLKKFIYLVVVLAIAFLFFLLVWKVLYPAVKSSVARGGDYQAVFLDGGQVYFGKVSNINSSFVYMDDVFYLQTNKGQNPVLVEFGTVETYGPENHIQINRDKIQSIQDLKSGSQVVRAIRDYRAGQ